MVKKIYKKLFILFLIILTGALGGMLGERFLFPEIAGLPWFSNFDFLKNGKENTVIINKTEKIVIEESQAQVEAVEKISSSLTGVKLLVSAPSLKIKKEVFGTGLILTSDGIILSPNFSWWYDTNFSARQKQSLETLFKNNKAFRQFFILKDGKEIGASLLKENMENNFLLLKTGPRESGYNLSAASFTEQNSLRLAQKTLEVAIEENNTKSVVSGIIKKIDDNGILTTGEKNLSEGAVLINLKGEVIGVNILNKDGVPNIILAARIKKLLESAL